MSPAYTNNAHQPTHPPPNLPTNDLRFRASILCFAQNRVVLYPFSHELKWSACVPNVCLAPEVDIALRLAFDPAGSKCPYLGSFQLLLSEEIDARRSLPHIPFPTRRELSSDIRSPVPAVRCLQHRAPIFSASQSRRTKIKIQNAICCRSTQIRGTLNATRTNAD
jgi:hypothetical protein